MYVCMYVIIRVITKSESRCIGNDSDLAPKQEATAHAPSVVDRLDLRWRNVQADQDSTEFSYHFASFQLWMCLEINTIVSFSWYKTHWIFKSSVTEQFNDRTKQLSDLNSRPGRLSMWLERQCYMQLGPKLLHSHLSDMYV